jgi:hypothetical protein
VGIRRVGKTPRGAHAISKTKLDALWKEICIDADSSRYFLKLRAAANIIGFCEFPVGWSWSEYERYRYEVPRLYEDRAKNIRYLGIKPDIKKQTSSGKKAQKNAAAFRKHKVEAFLNRLIVRAEVAVKLFDHDERGHTPNEKLTLDPQTTFNIEHSSYGWMDGYQWSCVLDGIELTQLLDGRRWKGERCTSYDWLLIERHIRNFFETFGSPKTNEQIFQYVLAECEGSEAANEPTHSTLRDLISDLREEYEFYDYRSDS